MILRVSEVFRGWLGWCPNAPAIPAAHPVLVSTPPMVLPMQPEGGDGRSGRIGRGIGFTMQSVKVLNRNKNLLWVSFLTGLVAGIVFIAEYCMGLLAVYPYDAIDFPRWVVLTFGIGLFAVFFCNVLLAGLLLSLSPQKELPVSFREGLLRTRPHLRHLADWSVILSLVCTALLVALLDLGFSRFSLYPVAQIFPFRFIFLPEVYHIGPMGGTYAMLYALASTGAMAAIILFLTVITIFVVPQLVLENRNLPYAVAGSFMLMKKVVVETFTVLFVIGVILFAVSLLSLLFRTVFEIVAPGMELFWYPGNAWIAAAVMFILVLCALAFIGATLAGIATLGLYEYAKTSRMPNET